MQQLEGCTRLFLRYLKVACMYVCTDSEYLSVLLVITVCVLVIMVRDVHSRVYALNSMLFTNLLFSTLRQFTHKVAGKNIYFAAEHEISHRLFQEFKYFFCLISHVIWTEIWKYVSKFK